MGRPLVPPDWTLADVRAHARAWSEPRAVARAALGVAVFLLTLAVASAGDGDVGGSTDWASFTRALLAGLGLGVGLGMAAGHLHAARGDYPRHVVSFPQLASSVARPLSRSEVVAAAVVAVAIGFGLPALASLSLGASLVLLAPTGPGSALARAADRAADAIGSEAGASARGPRGIASAAMTAGGGAVAIALLRVLWAEAPDCGSAWLGVPCGTDGAVLLAIGAGVGTWALAPLGAAIARSLEVVLRGPSDAAPATLDGREVGGATAVVDVEPSDLDELVDLVRDRFGTLTPDTRADVVTLVSRTLDGQAGSVADGDDVLDTLDAAIREAGPDRTVEAIGSLHQHVDTIGSLRRKHARVPRMAQSAVEKTAATAVRAAGVPRDVATPAVRALLTMPDDDWATVTATLDDVTRRFAPGKV